MKHTLKNRPKMPEEEFGMLHVSRAWGYYDGIEKWFEGFEKELRQWLSVLEMNDSKDKRAIVLRVILGEVES